ncbi:MAG: polysaccharide pyruvyl transferase family protein [Clostridium sp.]|nr:polysaccharide pyruvyl transferase family protein [Clostridium sp.]
MIKELRGIIEAKLKPLIPGDYMLLDAPYYHNIGDVLIWQGIHDFCKTLDGRNIGTSNITTCIFPDLSPSCTILLMGGGNFGDLWRVFQEFRIKAVEHYPNNRIIIFPQSVWYEDEKLIGYDYEIFKNHPNLYLCARDTFSYDFLKKYFSECNVLLIPDMAFFIDHNLLHKFKNKHEGKKLFLKRLDKELSDTNVFLYNNKEYETRDWPTYEKSDYLLWVTRRLEGVYYRTKNIPKLNTALSDITNSFAQIAIRKHLVKTGIKFLSNYDEIVTTRLHTMILAVLLGKDVRYIDNTTGKLSAFASTWLCDFENVKAYKH